MWIVFAFGSALFAGLTSILAKCGIKKTDSNVAVAIRTVVVLLFSWLMALLAGSFSQISLIGARTCIFLILSGLATGASWLCYFKALQLGRINQVVLIDKSSIVLTILLAFLFLGEEISWLRAIGTACIGTGTFLMVERKETEEGKIKKRPKWLFYAFGSAVFASLTSILGKIGISNVESNLGTAVRTMVVLLMAWMMVFVTGKWHAIKEIPKKEAEFLILSGLATGASWLCYYKALQDGPASAVVPIDKLSMVITVLFSWFVFGERLSKKAAAGFFLILAGTFAMLIP